MMNWDGWRTVTDWVDKLRSDDEDAATGSETESLFDPLAYDPETLAVRADITTELGLLPAEFVQRVIEAEGGKIRQQDFTKYANFSASTVCRMLQALEEAGEIRRFRFGREKVVTAADKTLPTLELSETATDTQLAGISVDSQPQNVGVSESW